MTYENKAPWPFYNGKTASRRLGVPMHRLAGMAKSSQGRLRVFQTTGKTGAPYFLFNREDVDEMLRIMQSA